MAYTPMNAAVAAALASAIGAVSGCNLRPSIRPCRAAAPGPAMSGYTLTVDGYSPSLHGIGMDWPVFLSPADAPGEQTVDALAQLAPRLELQRRRADAAIAIGRAFPLEISSTHPTEIEHLHADAGALSLLLLMHGRDHRPPDRAGPAIGVIRHEVQRLHYAATRQPSPTILRHQGTGVLERGTLRIVEFEATIAGQGAAGGSGIATMRDATIRLPGQHLPETILDTLPGRTMGDVLRTHGHLNRRTIRSVRQGRDGLAITLQPAPVRIGDVIDLTGPDAFEHLTSLKELAA